MAFFNFGADGTSTRTGQVQAPANLAASATTANNVHIIANNTPSAVDVYWNTDALTGLTFWALPSPSAGGTLTANHASDHGASDVNAGFTGLNGGNVLEGTLQAGSFLAFAFNNSGIAGTNILSSNDIFTARHGTVAARGGDVFVSRVDN